jgi:hypothetical protein
MRRASIGGGVDPSRRAARPLSRGLSWLVLVFATIVGRASAQAGTSDTTGSVTGVVFDSLIARRPASGAEVVIIGLERYARTDARGRFRIDSVPAGSYEITFSSRALDSLDVSVSVWPLRISAGGVATVSLATPSMRTVHERLCGTRDSTTAVVVGRVRDADSGAPVADVRVAATWSEYALASTGLTSRDKTSAATTDPAGTFQLCGVPNDIPATLIARRGVNATGIVVTVLQGATAAFRSLTISVDDTVPEIPAGDSVYAAPVRGTARVAGVVTSSGGRPMSNARVRLLGMPTETRTDSAGRFLLSGLPGGTQTIQVVSLGSAPARSVVDLSPGSVARVAIALDRAGAVLETMTIVGKRPARASTIMGFAQRQQAGFGHFVTQADIERRKPFNLSDMFVTMPGVLVTHVGFSTIVRMTRGAGIGRFGNGCTPTFFLDGSKVTSDETMTLDDLVRPSEVLGVEVYAGFAGAPAFALGDASSCGTIVVWTRRGS